MINLNASDLPRIMVCNGSVFMNEPELISSGDNTVRNEGLSAHWLVEQVHSGKFEAYELIDRKSPYGTYITTEMVDFLERYLQDIGTHDTGSVIEYRNAYSFEGGIVSGRADVIKHYPNVKTFFVADLKYGWSIVEPVNNWTLISHAIGFLQQNPDAEIENFVFAIYQPRPYHRDGIYRTLEVNRKEFDILSNTLLTTLSNLRTELITDVNVCRKCPHFTSCPAARKANMNAIDVTEQLFDDTLSNDQLMIELTKLENAYDLIKGMKNSYVELAEYRLKNGQQIKGYGLEYQVSNTSWIDGVTPQALLMLTGEEYSVKKLMTPTQAKREGLSEEVFTSLTERRKIGVRLTKLDVNDKATKLFGKKET